jgi:serine protease Do
MVFAFGSPFRFDFSMSQGIVSATGRSRVGILGRDGYENFIQTDAAINPGNSGGPLVNIRGEVIGMNTAIASRDGGFNGLGFAIPVSMVTTIADTIIKDGKVQRGFLGIEIVDVTQDWADSFGYDSTKGALVMNVLPGGAAASADIKPGDIITAVGDNEIIDVVELRAAIAAIKPGKPVDVKIFRDGEAKNVSVTLGSRNDVQLAGTPEGGDTSGDVEASKNERLLEYGLTGVETLTTERAEELGVEFQPGVLVTALRDGSVAAGNLRRGTLITDVFDQKVTCVTELTEAINRSDRNKPLRMKVMTWDAQNQRWNTGFALLKLPEL